VAPTALAKGHPKHRTTREQRSEVKPTNEHLCGSPGRGHRLRVFELLAQTCSTMRTSVLAAVVAFIATLFVTNPMGPSRKDWPEIHPSVDWSAPPPLAATSVDDLWVVSVARARGNRGRETRHWVGVLGAWHRLPASLDPPLAAAARRITQGREWSRRLTPPQKVVAVQVALFFLTSPQVWGSSGGLLGVSGNATRARAHPHTMQPARTRHSHGHARANA
jgi:hypothetical protein